MLLSLSFVINFPFVSMLDNAFSALQAAEGMIVSTGS